MDLRIKEQAKKYRKEYSRILSAIKRYDNIVIFRHILPDYDALGTQMGLATWIKDNFPNKTVKVVGDNHVTFTPRLFPVMDNLTDEDLKKPFLSIIVDVANKNRIADPRFKKGKFKIRLDHHPLCEEWGNVSIIDPSLAAASELVASMLLSWKNKYTLSPLAASYFYIGLVGDSGRFLYSSTTSHTFEVAEGLIDRNIVLSNVYQKMYVRKLDDLKVTAYILNNFKVSPKGVAYYVLDAKLQKELNITTERGKENVNLFANVEGINAWCSITEDPSPKDPCWRVSIRSREKAINGVAAMFGGGGHAQASGARLDSLNDLDRFIAELDKLF